MQDNRIYLGTILLEPNRWPDRPDAKFSLAQRLCRGRAALPAVRVSPWLERAKADGFDGAELWENHALLCDDAEFAKLCATPLPIAVYSSYFGLDDGDAEWREVAAEAVRRLNASGVKYNFGAEPARREVYLRNLRAWAEMLPPDVRIVCECHLGNLAETPAAAAALLAELGDDRFQATVHLVESYGKHPLEEWLAALGPRVGHVHTGHLVEKGREWTRRMVGLLRQHNFAGSLTIEFTTGIEWGKPAPDLETLYDCAVADLRLLREAMEDIR
jgi:sugar phosphate isomerase/epimerase